MSFFPEHPLRHLLSDEVHARPPVSLGVPEHVTYLAFLHHEDSETREAEHLSQLAVQVGAPPPRLDSGHFFLDAGEFRLKWEKHNEFSSYTFFRRGSDASADDDTPNALLAVPTAWRNQIPGQLIIATHVDILSARHCPPVRILARQTADGAPLTASQIAAGAGWVFTDFQIEEHFSRFLVLNESLTPRQAGRTVQRLLEIETYRVIALLAFPVAKEVRQLLSRAEAELADIMDGMGEATTTDDGGAVLTRLTRLAAEVEHSVARTTYRFGAAAAYYRLVQQRIDELREVRLPGFTTINEFMERRLAPAINTCATIARRQEDLSGRIARNSQLLRTRVDIELERQNQELLTQMNRRVKLQLHLQQTVEGLSIVAITYYASQLVQYLAKGAKDWIAPATPELITAASIPVIALVVAAGLRRTRAHLAAAEK